MALNLRKKHSKFLIWICLPLILFLLPLIIRLVFIRGYYFTHASLALSLVVLSLIFGIAVIVFTGKGERLFLSQFSFAANFNLIVGLFLYTLEMSETPWKEYLRKILGEDDLH
jgi:small-conductance mechanosensitive channel